MNAADILEQRYRLERPLGSGGMAEVWLAEDLRLGRWVAVKILSESLQADDLAEAGLDQSIQREARTIASLQHPNIVGIFDTGTVEGRSYLVMEYVQGHTVRELLDASGRMAEADAIKYGQQVAAALHYAHQQGIVHCDVKPENILINEQGVAKVADFGVAGQVTRTLTPAQAREVLGTIGYLAPEVLQGTQATPASDIYSLALTIYEMVSGKLPFSGPTPAAAAAQRLANPAPALRSVFPGASPALEATLITALATRPAQRHATAEAFRQSLQRAQQALGRTTTRVAPLASTLPPAAAAPPPRRPNRTSRVAYQQPGDDDDGRSSAPLIIAIVGVLLLALGVGAVAAVLIAGNGGNGTPSPTPTPTEGPTEEPSPTEEPTVVPTPEPTLTPTPEPTPTEEPTPTATPTPEPTPTPEVTPTVEPTPAEEVEGASIGPPQFRGNPLRRVPVRP